MSELSTQELLEATMSIWEDLSNSARSAIKLFAIYMFTENHLKPQNPPAIPLDELLPLVEPIAPEHLDEVLNCGLLVKRAADSGDTLQFVHQPAFDHVMKTIATR